MITYFAQTRPQQMWRVILLPANVVLCLRIPHMRKISLRTRRKNFLQNLLFWLFWFKWDSLKAEEESTGRLDPVLFLFFFYPYELFNVLDFIFLSPPLCVFPFWGWWWASSEINQKSHVMTYYVGILIRGVVSPYGCLTGFPESCNCETANGLI